jgi:hypothetical protein
MKTNAAAVRLISVLFRKCSFLCLALALTTNAFATFYRGSSASYSIAGNGIVTIDVFSVWRSDFAMQPAFQMRTGPNGTGTLLGNFGFASSQSPYAMGTENINPLTGALAQPPSGYTVRRDQFNFNLAGRPGGTYYARWTSCCRVSGIRNAPAADWSLELKIVYQPGKASSGPTMVPLNIDVVGRGFPYVQTLNSVDPDGTAISYELITGSAFPNFGPDFNIPGLNLTGRGRLNISAQDTATLQPGRWVYKVRATDAEGGTAERDAVVLVQDPFGNQPPLLEPIGPKTVALGSTLSFSVRGTDAANQKLTLRSPRLPSGALFPQQSTVGTVNSTFSWTPQPGQEGTYYVNFELLDEGTTTLTTSELVEIKVVLFQNTPPVAANQNITLAEDNTVALALAGSDADGDALTFLIVSGPAHGSLAGTGGTRTYTPNPNFNGTDTFTYKVSDGQAESAVATVKLTVNPVNDAPVVANPLPDTILVYGELLSYSVAPDAFDDIESGHALALSLAGLPPGVSFDPSTATLSGVPTFAGVYDITVTAQDSGDNGTPALAVSDLFRLTVERAPLLIRAENKTKLYGAALPELTATFQGFVNGDSAAQLALPPILTTGATASSSVGTYSINVGGAASANYTIAYAAGILSVTPAPLIITAENKAKVYGADLPELTATFEGFVNGDSVAQLAAPPVLTTTATASSTVGTYPINVGDAASANYTIAYQGAILSVTPAPLIVSADNKTKVYGADLPTLTATFEGFVNGDTSSAIEPLQFNSTAGVSTDAGTYPGAIVVSATANENYTIQTISGTLTVEKAPLVATATAQRQYGQPNPPLIITYSGFVLGQDADVIDLPPIASTSATVDSVVSQYPIQLSGGSDNNYSIQLVNGTLTVTPAALVASITAPESAYLAQVFQNIDFSGTFSKSGQAASTGLQFYIGVWDLHSATIDTVENATISDVSTTQGSVADTFSFETPGVYSIRLLITDAAGTIAKADKVNGEPAFVVIYDPNGSFITGGGWINSPAGALTSDPTLVGRVNFGFVSKYKRGTNIPEGATEFQFKAGNLNFKSTTYDWLVVAGERAQCKGSGSINGQGDYGFLLSAVDGQFLGSSGSDRFRIKIWNKNSGGIIYDNQMHAGDNEPLNGSTVIGGGNIVIQKQ